MFVKKKVCVVCLCIIFWGFGLWRGYKISERKRKLRKNHRGGRGRKTRRWENSTGETAGKERKENNEGGRERWWKGMKEKEALSTFSFPQCLLMYECAECVSLRAYRQLWINHALSCSVIVCSMRTIETSWGKLHPSVSSLGLSSSWDDFVSLETKVRERRDGCCQEEWVGSHQARSCSIQTRSALIVSPLSYIFLFLLSCQSATLWKWLF